MSPSVANKATDVSGHRTFT